MIEILPNWHPIFVHFTVALLVIAALFHVLSHFVSNKGLANQWIIVARWNLWLGIGFTLLTVAAGWYAYYTVNHDTPSHIAMTEHRNWAMGTLALFLGIAAWEYYLHRHGKGKGWLFTGLLVIAAGLVVSTAWHGGELVYRYGLGVMALPKPDGPGHAHDHGDGQSDTHGDSSMPGAATSQEAAGDGQAHSHEAGPGTDDHHNNPAGNVDAAPPTEGHAHPPGSAPHED